MGKVKTSSSSDKPRQMRPALTPEAQENQMISLAVDLAAKQLREGTASSQVITHYLKLASTEQKIKLEKLKQENALLAAKTEAIQSQQRSEALFQDAIKAFGIYSGANMSEAEDDEYDY